MAEGGFSLFRQLCFLTGGGFPRRVPIFRTITLTPTTTDDVGDERCHLGWRTFQRDADETVVFGL